ncbi:MAG: hypothetical protein IPO91_03295 [Chloroflexi bacterium]|nr:hypothetical protein [Chloroflexota bacterium]
MSSLALIILKCISDSFQALYDKLIADPFAGLEDRDEYLVENIFFVPEEDCWSFLERNAKNQYNQILS